jgi:hypothetical protein
MRARHRVFLAVLIASVSVALSPAHVAVPSATAPTHAARLETHNCPNGTAWDNFLRRCV